MYSCCPGRKADYLPVKRLTAIALAIGKCFQILFEGIHVRSHGNHPVCVKGLFDIFLFPSLF